MIYEDIKFKLLNTGLIVENEYFYRYIDLIYKNLNNEYLPKFEVHHIIPKIYFKHNNIEIDNSLNNLVYLSYSDHCMSHYLLFKCSLDYLKTSSMCAYQLMVSFLKTDDNKRSNNFKFQKYFGELSKEEIELLQKYYEDTIFTVDKESLYNFWVVEDHTIKETIKYFSISKAKFYRLIKLYNISKKKNSIDINEDELKEELYDYYIINNNTFKQTILFFTDKYNVKGLYLYNLMKEFNKQKILIEERERKLYEKEINKKLKIKTLYDQLYKYYIIENHSIRECAEFFNKNESTIRRWCYKYNIIRR